MGIEAVWEIIVKFLWPLLLGYAAYLHREIANVMAKFDRLQANHFEHVAQVNKDFATREVVAQLENKLIIMLNRIDDKITKILEQERK